jgi:hypothetical protein
MTLVLGRYHDVNPKAKGDAMKVLRIGMDLVASPWFCRENLLKR